MGYFFSLAKMHMRATIFILMVAMIFQLFACSKKNPFPEIHLPVYDGAYDVQEIFHQPEGTKALVYRLNMEYPANDLINFYREHFDKKGFVHYSLDGQGKCVWESFNSKTAEWDEWDIASSNDNNDSEPERFFCSWTDSNRRLRIILRASIRPYMKEEYLEVGCQVYPFFDIREEMDSAIKALNISVYPEAKNLEYFSMKKGLIQGINYEVTLNYPAKDIIKFYEARMPLLGYHVSDDINTDRSWFFFIDGIKNRHPYVGRYFAAWEDRDQTKRVLLELRYYWYDYPHETSEIILQNNDDLKVSCQTMPYVTEPTRRETNSEF